MGICFQGGSFFVFLENEKSAHFFICIRIEENSASCVCAAKHRGLVCFDDDVFV